MKCDEVQAVLVEYLLKEVDEKTRAHIALHLERGCDRCRDLERELAEAIDGLWTAVPEVPITPQHRLEILAGGLSTAPNLRLHTEAIGNANHFASSKTRFSSSFGALPYLLAFAGGILLMAFCIPPRSIHPSIEKIADTPASVPSDSFAVNPATIPVDSELSAAKQSKTILIAMEKANEASKMTGQIVWDNLNHEVHFFGSGIDSPSPGMGYVIWLTDKKHLPLASKKLTVDERGRCKATVVSSNFDVGYVFITLESRIASVQEPSTDVLLSLDVIGSHLTKL